MPGKERRELTVEISDMDVIGNHTKVVAQKT